eukprot:CAMPEP_0182456718 /NCGR_PEP_ID=MMETSP1319-20130603/2489_1 /TAXON_ID=172717 /ORGANISM="Bolidomonas pacifica, Strain RCC208" /LENGTH=210 /DNA_ID=CAMNT_0024655033 /DNA_START=134 /DNA_END=762 /DNA_ORIENTATION=-
MSSSEKSSKKSTLFAGMTFALSTIDPSGSSGGQYAVLQSLLLSHSAKVIDIVARRRLTCLLTTGTARKAKSQKFRKAVKRGVKVVDVGWVEECVEKGRKCGFGEWLCEEEGDDDQQEIANGDGDGDGEVDVEGAAAAKVAPPRSPLTNFCVDVTDVEVLGGGGKSGVASLNFEWSEPVSFGCSCVCHENQPGVVTDCEWCPAGECDVNRV